MRHAGPRKRSNAALLVVMTPLAGALVAGFTWGVITSSGSALPSASARTPSPSAATATPTVEPIVPASAVVTPSTEPEDPSAPAEEVVQEGDASSASGDEPEVDWGDPYIDESWPADEKGDGCDAPVWPAAAPDANRVLLIGDSLFRNARGMLEDSLTVNGWTPTVRCWGATGTDWGAGQVERARELGQLPQTVVLSFGTNDIWWLGIPMEDAVDQMMAALGSERDVYWVNLWYNTSAYDDLPDPGPANDILAAKTAEYPNLYVIDFARAFDGLASAGVDVGWTDGVHLNETANQLRTDLIIAALGG